MAKVAFASVDEYIAAQPEPIQRVLQRVRNGIAKAVPEAEETIAYNIPTFKLRGKTVLHFAGWKNHYSIYPANSRVVAAFKDELAGYTIEKSTLQLSYRESVPVQLIGRIAQFRAEETSHLRHAQGDTQLSATSAITPERRRGR